MHTHPHTRTHEHQETQVEMNALTYVYTDTCRDIYTLDMATHRLPHIRAHTCTHTCIAY